MASTREFYCIAEQVRAAALQILPKVFKLCSSRRHIYVDVVFAVSIHSSPIGHKSLFDSSFKSELGRAFLLKQIADVITDGIKNNTYTKD